VLRPYNRGSSYAGVSGVGSIVKAAPEAPHST
jgi:hypothetical protein